jgi:S1-C subfamily serine protease
MSPASKTLLALTLAAAFGGFAATALRDGLHNPAAAATPALLPANAALPASTAGGTPMPSLAPMLQKVLPAVVSVHSEQHVQVSPFGNDPIFSRMFPELTQERINRSLGSGVIVDAAKGYVLTNHHVIEGADAVSVTLSDGRTLKAEFLGSDPDTDVALMRIPAQDLTAIPLGNSGALRVGDFVVAVGNPFGLGQTVTSGIVSAVGRSNLPGAGYQNFIQTDASINPGNSGGALVNLNGELVGINTASFNPRGSMAGNIGLGFAIPADIARNIMGQLIANNGVVRRGTLGVETQDVDARRAKALGLADARGGAGGVPGLGRGRGRPARRRRDRRRERPAHRRRRGAAQFPGPAVAGREGAARRDPRRQAAATCHRPARGAARRRQPRSAPGRRQLRRTARNPAPAGRFRRAGDRGRGRQPRRAQRPARRRRDPRREQRRFRRPGQLPRQFRALATPAGVDCVARRPARPAADAMTRPHTTRIRT